MQISKYNVTVRRFDPRRGLDSGEVFVVPVDSPDAEHAVSNVVAFTAKVEGDSVVPVAFCCVAVGPRAD